MASPPAVTKACCTLPPVQSSYQAQGAHGKVGDLDVYFAGPEDAQAAIVFIYDIFGPTPQAFQGADLLAAATGYRVAVPDVLRGQQWSLDNFPPPDRGAFMAWVGDAASWDKIAGNDVPPLLEHLKAGGATKFAAVGFCWGGKVAVTAATRAAPGTFSCVGSPHYSFLEPSDLAALPCPVALLASKDEGPEAELLEALKGKSFADRCLFRRFPDMQHGWTGTRGDWAVPEQAARATEALQMLASFCKDNVGV